jgi:hypothetical protein
VFPQFVTILRTTPEPCQQAAATRRLGEDEDISVLVLGATKDPSGPGPLVSTHVGRYAGTFAVPITVVPGCLGIEEILALA